MSHNPDKPMDTLKNHFFGTALKGEGKIEEYDEEKARALSRAQQFNNLPVTKQFKLAIAQIYWKYAIKEYELTICRGDKSRILSLVWVGHAKDILLHIDIKPHAKHGTQRYFWQHGGHTQQVSWRTSTHKVKMVMLLAGLFIFIFLLQIPKVIFYTDTEAMARNLHE